MFLYNSVISTIRRIAGMKTIPDSRRRHHVVRVGIFLIAAALIAGIAGCGDGGNDNPPPQEGEIRTWYDLAAVEDNLASNYTLMNDLDSTSAGYEELASPTANGGKGWAPIGFMGGTASFTGTFDGQGYEICDLFINLPGIGYVGLFSIVDEGGRIENIGLVNATVTGQHWVGGLVGVNIQGTVYNSYSNGNVTGDDNVGGLVGSNSGTVYNSYSTGNVAGQGWVGGLVGYNDGTVYNSYSTGNVTGQGWVGGLVGANHRPLTNSYSTGSVSGEYYVGGLMGENTNDVSNSYSTGSVIGENYVGGLVGRNREISHWPNTVTKCYSTGSVTGNEFVGGLVGWNEDGSVSDSFWDTQTSGQPASAGGTGKNTTEMKDIATFSAWNIIAVSNSDLRNLAYIWNIVDDETYPFLSWEPVS